VAFKITNTGRPTQTFILKRLDKLFALSSYIECQKEERKVKIWSRVLEGNYRHLKE